MNLRTCRSEENTNTRTHARSLHVVKMESKCPRSQGKLDLLWHSNEFWEVGGEGEGLKNDKGPKTNGAARIPVAKQDVANLSFLAVVA